MQAMFDSIDHADLVVLAFPLYVDSLPAPITAVWKGSQRIAMGISHTFVLLL